MRYDAAIVVAPRETIAEVARRAEAKPGAPLMIYARAGEWRLLDRDEIARLAAQTPGDDKITEASSKGPLPVLFRDQSLEEALHCMGDWLALPVVNRGELGNLEGVITLADILRVYRDSSAE